MLLTISTTHQPATDLGYLMHKHPDKLQSFEMNFGKIHIFYPEASIQKTTIAVLLEIDPVGLVRNNKGPGESSTLDQYVNDRPYVASSFMSVAISKTLSSALNGHCKDRPELTEIKLPFEICVSVISSRGGERLIKNLFEPLGYEVNIKGHQLDPSFPAWGQSKYFTLTLKNEIRLSDLLSHLYVLFPVLDNEKHYWISTDEVEKLISKGSGWLKEHPEKKEIVRRYLKNQGSLVRDALSQLIEVNTAANEDLPDDDIEVLNTTNNNDVKNLSLHNQRIETVFTVIKNSGAVSVLDLGCGEGKLLKLLIKENQFKKIVGLDVSHRCLEIAKSRIKYEQLSSGQQEKIKFLLGSLTYKDKRLEGYDAAAIVEVIEHLDAARLGSFERVVFEWARPKTVIITTPNSEYNVKYEKLSAGAFRHNDHRFEWTRTEFENWANKIADKNNYSVSFEPLGDLDENVGAPSQMGIFKKNQ